MAFLHTDKHKGFTHLEYLYSSMYFVDPVQESPK